MDIDLLSGVVLSSLAFPENQLPSQIEAILGLENKLVVGSWPTRDPKAWKVAIAINSLRRIANDVIEVVWGAHVIRIENLHLQMCMEPIVTDWQLQLRCARMVMIYNTILGRKKARLQQLVMALMLSNNSRTLPQIR